MLDGYDSRESLSKCTDYAYAHQKMAHRAPKHHFPETGTSSKVAYRMIMDEMNLDGNPNMNLATFVTTYMEQEAIDIMVHGMSKNIIDIDEYSQSAEMGVRCVNFLANLWHAPLDDGENATGTATVGSSEAIMLAGLAMKWRWKEKRRAQGKPIDKPNCVFGANVQVCWHKMCKYFDIECREAAVSSDNLCLTAERAKPLIDENTIGVCPILGSTFNGEFEDVKGIHDMLVELNKETGWDVPIHVDAASGGFIAPFIDPDLEWDFQLPLVKSINTSGHKFGLVYAGIGWVVFREKQDLPDDLVFHVNYLGGDQASFTLNFSKGAANIIGQYYQIVRLGKDGYRQVMEISMKNAAYLRKCLVETGKFNVVDKAHMPLVAFSLKDTTNCSVFDLQDKLSSRGWIVPAYTCPEGAKDLAIMRVVVKQNFSCDMADMLVNDMQTALEHFEHNPAPKAKAGEVSTPKSKWGVLRNKIHAVHCFSHNVHRESGETTYGVC
jgi:glutamate decarboxylase